MPRLTILTDTEKKAFRSPPIFTQSEREEYFRLDETITTIVTKLASARNQVGFLLQWGYFIACGRFFLGANFAHDDIEYVKKLLGITEYLTFQTYQDRTYLRHQSQICKLLGYTPFDKIQKEKLLKQIAVYIKQCMQPKKIIFTLMQQYRYEKCVPPSFDTLCRFITDCYNTTEEQYLAHIKTHLTKEQLNILDRLLPPDEIKTKSYQRAKLTLLKRLNQVVRPKKIKQSLEDFSLIEALYQPFITLIDDLNLTDQAVQYYAGWVLKATASQIKQFPEPMKRYLHLIAFIIHQYRHYQDNFVDIVLKAVQSMLNRIERKKVQAHYLAANERNTATQLLFDERHLMRGALDKIRETGMSSKLTSQQKVRAILKLVDEAKVSPNDLPLIDQFEAQLTQSKNNAEHFNLLEVSASQLHRKINGLVKVINFDTTYTPEVLTNAITYFQSNSGQIASDAPVDFLTPLQQEHLYNNQKQFRPLLYKVLLFLAIVDAIKANTLTVKASYRYQYLEHYLTEKTDWSTRRDELLKKYGLTEFSHGEQHLITLKEKLNTQFCTVNTHYQSGENSYLRFNPQGEMVLTTPKVEKPDIGKISELLSPYRYTPVLKILSDVNSVAPFIQKFTHYSVKNVKSIPSLQTILAGIVAQGCNIGADKMANTSKGVDLNALNHALTWRFSLENIHAANDTIIELIRSLPLSTVYSEGNEEYTSSDGQKHSVAGESLNANASFKYFGHGKGVSIYTFIDEKFALFYSTVMSSSEREAAYVLDGLLHNEAIQSDIHSTDTHGFTEIIFALSHLLGVTFAPRIAKLKKQLLYSITPKHHLQKKDYAILPNKTARTGLIKSEWENILRIIVAIKSKKTTASQVVKRLSSYTKANPVYKALRELGRVIKTHFILTYIDDVTFRQRIQKQLNKIELSHRFSNAVFFDNNQTFQQVTKEDQEIAASCKRLIQNSIILWNYLVLSKLINKTKRKAEKKALLQIIRHGSMIAWSHVNMQGEYNFLAFCAANQPAFDLTALSRLKVA